jgi:murein DD-endopeptidase
MRIWRSLIALSFALMAHAAIAQRAPLQQSFDLRVPWMPPPVVVSGKVSLVYELHLTSYAQEPLTLRRIEVVDDRQHVLLDLSGAALADAMGRADRAKGNDRLRVQPGMNVVAYLSVPIAGVDTAHLKHRVMYEDAAAHEETVEGAAMTSRPPASKALGPPLRGGPWVAIYDARWERGHRRVIYATSGAATVPGRFAIDWIRVAPQGGFARGDGALPTQWLGYGADVLAVTDATVASVGEGVEEPSSLKQGAARKVPLEEAAGNYVALDLGDGRYAFYEHLQPGSITVKRGQHVRQGAVIGKLGFTGESTGPHLHFHVSDANAPLAAEGLPYALSSFRVLGAYASIEDFAGGKAWLHEATPTIAEGFPAPLSVVDFGSGH